MIFIAFRELRPIGKMQKAGSEKNRPIFAIGHEEDVSVVLFQK